MKLFNKITITAISEISALAFFMIIPVIILNYSWWWFFAPLIFIIISDIIIGIIIAIIKFTKKKKPEVMKINIKDAKRKAIYDMKHEDDNPDNFKILKEKTIHIGEKGAEKTPILILEGFGTELNERRVIIINMNDRQRQTKLTDPSNEEIVYHAKLISDNPPEEIMEETRQELDAFGRPKITTITRKPSPTETIKKQEEVEAEKQNAF